MWVATDPYLDLDMSGGVLPDFTASTSYTVTQGIDDQTNAYYFIRAAANCGVTSMEERFGDFNFAIVPGS